MRRRTVLILFGSVIAIATVTTTIIISTFDNRSSRAKDVVVRPVHLVTDQAPINDFAIPAPVLDAMMPGADQAVFVRKMKANISTTTTVR